MSNVNYFEPRPSNASFLDQRISNTSGGVGDQQRSSNQSNEYNFARVFQLKTSPKIWTAAADPFSEVALQQSSFFSRA